MISNRDNDIEQFPSKEAFWQFHSNQWEQSGISQRAYCIKESIPLAPFHYWREKLTNQTKAYARDATTKPIKFAQSLTTQHVPVATVSSTIQLHLSNTIRIEWPISASQELAKFLKEYTT